MKRLSIIQMALAMTEHDRAVNASELIQHQRRVTAWTLQDQRAKELAARQVVEDVQ